jgi:hypothetical protein
MLGITPDFKPHSELERAAIEYISGCGYFIISLCYHEVMPREIKERIRFLFSLSALYVRSRADRLAIHRSQDKQFEFECKAHSNKNYSDLAIEAYPAMMHLAKRDFIDTLYIFEVNGRQGGFWVSHFPTVRQIIIPGRPQNQRVAPFIILNAPKFFPGVPVYESWPVNGSGDPFAIIDQSEIAQLPDWRTLIS